MTIDGIIEPPHAGWDRYIHNALETNRVHPGVSDGEYLCVDEYTCGMVEDKTGDSTTTRFIPWEEGAAPCQFVYSTTKVTVRSGMFDLGQLLQAAGELKEKTHYWGVFLEGVRWVNNPGDFRKRCAIMPNGLKDTSCERHPVEDMTDQEKALWANGLLMLTWGS